MWTTLHSTSNNIFASHIQIPSINGVLLLRVVLICTYSGFFDTKTKSKCSGFTQEHPPVVCAQDHSTKRLLVHSLGDARRTAQRARLHFQQQQQQQQLH